MASRVFILCLEYKKAVAVTAITLSKNTKLRPVLKASRLGHRESSPNLMSESQRCYRYTIPGEMRIECGSRPAAALAAS